MISVSYLIAGLLIGGVFYYFGTGLYTRRDLSKFKVPAVRRGNEWLVWSGGVDKIDEYETTRDSIIYHINGRSLEIRNVDMCIQHGSDGGIYRFDKRSLTDLFGSNNLAYVQANNEAEYFRVRAEVAESRAREDVLDIVESLNRGKNVQQNNDGVNVR